ncbi:hypothetical protein COOONC_22499 [Cooperia oncophora]
MTIHSQADMDKITATFTALGIRRTGTKEIGTETTTVPTTRS